MKKMKCAKSERKVGARLYFCANFAQNAQNAHVGCAAGKAAMGQRFFVPALWVLRCTAGKALRDSGDQWDSIP
jgi:hypothetical protein